MGNNFKDKLGVFFEKIKSDKKSLLIILLGILGMILIVCSEFSSDDTETKQYYESDYFDEEKQTADLEELISEVEGAGRVKVLITYECSNESVYAQDTEKQSDENSSKNSNEYILVDNGSDETGLLIKENYPKVMGVAVVCDGGGNPTVKNEITMMLKAIFNISSNNISILEMQK